MALSDTSKILISIKKLVGKSHTSNDKDVANESLPTGLTVSSNTVFGQSVPAHTGSASNYHVLSNSAGEGVVEFLRLSASFIVGSDTSSGRHGFSLKLPDDYASQSKNPKKGTDPFTNGRVIYLTTGSLQLIPPSYDSDYEAKPYHTGSGETQIPVLDARDWSLDYFNGVFFQQDPAGTGDNSTNPRYVDAYLYIGKMTSEIISSGSNENVFKTISVSGQSDVVADTTSDTLTFVGAGGTTITTNAGTDTITVSSTTSASTTGSFHVPASGEFVTTASVSFAGNQGFSYTADSIGTNVAFFVSGTQGSGGDAPSSGVAVFGGDVVVSGTLLGGSPLKIGGEIEFRGSSGGTRSLKHPSGSVKIFASNEVKVGSDKGTIRFIELGDSTAGRIYVTGSNDPKTSRRFKLFSKGQIHLVGQNPAPEDLGSDVFVFISGSVGSKQKSERGVTLLGGDAVFSGSISTLTGLSGSLTKLSDGSSYIEAGSGISVLSSSNGKITVSSTSSSARFKKYLNVTASHATNNNLYVSEIDFSIGGYSANYIDIFVNGQLMLSGSQAEVTSNAVDYTIAANKTNALRFAFGLDIDDIIAATVFQSGSS